MSFAGGGSYDKDPEKLPVFSGGLHNVAQIKTWQEILSTETKMQREWEEKWGYFKAPTRLPRSQRARNARLASAATQAAQAAFDAGTEPPGATGGQAQSLAMGRPPLGSSASAPSLATAGRGVMGTTRDPMVDAASSGGRQSERSSAASTRNDDRQRALHGLRSKIPQERYGKQLTTQHGIGWTTNRPSLEIFGVVDHPFPNTGELFAD
mmetsp:Transcript_109024/g.307285  ORF Transcript_109024/g.307285 Transcript_109024/m.307285 type:complete len:209 (-) Transcript_109024:164-790(-)